MVSESYLTFVLEQLDGVRRVVTKRMFGGVGLYSDEDASVLVVWAVDSIAATAKPKPRKVARRRGAQRSRSRATPG